MCSDAEAESRPADSPDVTSPTPEKGDAVTMMHTRRRGDQLALALAEANHRIGVLRAIAIVKAPLLSGDLDGAIEMCNELTREAIQPVPSVPVLDDASLHAGLVAAVVDAAEPATPLTRGERFIAWCWRKAGFKREYDVRDEEA